ncbi:MAG TPA: choice-of-anchor D domain-containing protein [Bryobacteraceae bacterium]|nr:choice-of-anchor D domain-containing protein [Bryobacteraceae bacterium]
MNRILIGFSLVTTLSFGSSIHAADQDTRLPLYFEPNIGQGDPAARFLAHGATYSVKLESSRAVLDIDARTVAVELLNASAQPKVQGEAPLPGKANYIGSSDPQTWFKNVPTYSRILYRGVYPGIGLAFYGKNNRLEYDFLIDAGANPGRIGMRLTGAESAKIDAAGDLVLNIGKGEIRFHKPVAWQPGAAAKGRDLVEAAYTLRSAGRASPEVSFALGRYDPKRPLVIDPIVSLIYSVYVGASASAVAVDSSGNTYVTGVLSGYGYYVTKFSPTGTVIYTTSFGAGVSYATPYALAVDNAGRAYVAGYAAAGLPTTNSAYQTSNPSSSYSAFLSVLSADGSTLDYATYLGGTSGSSYATGVAVDSSRNAYLTGVASPTFPVTSGAYDTTFSGSYTGFIAKINPSLSGTNSLVYSTFLGANGSYLNAIAVDTSGNAYVTGNMTYGSPITSGAFAYTGADSTSGGVYVTELNPAGSALVYSAYLGYGTGWGIAVDGAGSTYVTGSVAYADFPTTNGAYQTTYAGGFVTKLPPGGATETYSTFLSGPSGYISSNVTPSGIAIPFSCASSCSAYISGQTTTTDFPLISAVQAFPSSSESSGFVTELSVNGSSAALSTYLSGATATTYSAVSNYYSNSVPALAVDSSGNISVIENVSGTDFPVTIPGTSTIGVLAKIGPATAGYTWATPTSINFNGQPVNVSTSITNGTAAVTLRNLGSTAVTLQPVQVSPPAIFSESDNCSGSIPAGGYCTLDVNFTPAASGQRSGTLTVTSNASNSPATFTLSGTGVDEPYFYTPTSSLTFADQAVGTLSAAQAVTITNMGDQTTTLSLSTSPADFTELNNCPSQLAPGSSCTANVSFIPTTPGLRTGYLNISPYGTGSVSLSGTGTVNGNATGLALSATSLNFGVQTVGTTSTGQYVYITNTSTAPVTINSMTVGANYVLNNYSCTVPGQIAPQSNCYVYLQFAPTAARTLAGTLTINDSTPANPHTVPLTGTGQAATKSLEFYPGTAIDFPDQAIGYPSTYQIVYVYNAGDSPVTIDRVETTGNFQIYETTCEAATIAGATPGPRFSYCYVYVTFTPSKTGAQTGTLTILDNTPNSPHILKLAGNGVAATGAISATPTQLTYASQPVGITSSSQLVTVTNPGNTPVTVTGQTATGDYAVTEWTGNCPYGTIPYTLAPGEYCEVYTALTPTTTGARNGTLTITSSAGNQTIALSGAGAAATQTIGLTPTALGFGSQVVALPTGPYYVYARNTGTETVTFTATPTITGTNAADFSVNPVNCNNGYTVAPNSSCNFYVTFTPGASGARAATLKLTDSAGTQSLALTGTGVTTKPTYTVSNSEIAYDLQVRGTISPLSQFVYFYNNGTTNVTLGTDAITGNFLVPTGYDSCSGQVVAAGGFCYTYVEFAPTTSGYLTGTLAFKNSGGTALVSVSLAGYAPAPLYTAYIDPGALNFAPEVLGLTTGYQIAYLYNTGNLPLTVGTGTGTNTIIGASTSGEFSTTSPGDYCSGTTVAAGSDCYVYFTFTPSSTGAQTGSITLPVTYSNNSTANFKVTLAGSGVAVVDSAVLSPTAATFLDQVVGTTSTSVQLTLTNSGNLTLNIGTLSGVNIAVGSSTTGEFSTTASGGYDGCSGVAVAPGSDCYIEVVFTPSATGARSGSVSFPVTYGDTTTVTPIATLSGNGIASSDSVQVTPAGIQFGNLIVNTGSANYENAVELTNTGNVPVTVGSDSVTGAFAISTDSCASSTIPAGGTCYVYVYFNPTKAGAASGTLTIADNSTGGPHNVGLAGTGVPASQQIVLSQSSVTFGNQPAGSTSSETVVYVSNQGNTSVPITSIVLGGTNAADFSMTNYCYSTAFAADTSCGIYLTFAPATTAVGARTASVTLTYGAGGSPQTITLSGTVVAPGPAAALSPSALSFAKQSVGVASAAQNFSVTNTGSANLTISLVTSTNSSEFPISSDGCSGAALTPGQQCVVGVQFSPKVGGKRSGAITVTDNATGSPQTLTLTGNGSGTPLAKFTPASLSFGNQNLGTTSAVLTVTLSNPGTDVLNITSTTLTGVDASEFAITANNCPASLAPNGSCTASATFTPSTAGVGGAAITFTDNANSAPGSVQNVALTGTGVAVPQAGLSPGSLTFANQIVNTVSPVQNVTLTNAGTGPLTVSSIAITGANATDFVQSNGCGISLPAGTNCTIAVSFAPVATGGLVASLTVTDNANNVARSTQSVTLSGTGLATPVVTSVSVTPNAGAGTTQAFSFVYSDSDGSTDLNTVYALFNTSTKLASACYVYYVQSSNLLYLENNAGTAAQGSVTPAHTGSVANSQCSINGAKSAVTTSGNNLTLAVNVTFKTAFAGTKNVYMNASGNEGQSSGGLTLFGTWNTSANVAPTATSITPASGTGTSQTFTLAFADTNGSQDLNTVAAIINTSTATANACYVYYVKAANAIYLDNDAGTGPQGSVTPGVAGTVSNSQCTISGTGATAASTGNKLTVAVPVAFQTAFTGARNVYLSATDDEGLTSGWQQLGTWTP